MLLTLCVFSIVNVLGTQSQRLDSAGCTKDEFPCNNGQCVEKTMWCDAELDCMDRSDELYCRSIREYGADPNDCAKNPSLFQCSDGKCIPKVGRCDGTKSCDDFSDEQNCDNVAVPKTVAHEKLQHEINQDRQLTLVLVDSPYYEDLEFGDYEDHLQSAREWLLSQQNGDFSWGENTARAIIAMHLSSSTDKSDEKSDMLMDKQLDIQLGITLTRNDTKEITLSEFSLYINALVAACMNPRNYHGIDLVSSLREKVDLNQRLRTFVNPFVYLTLCMNNVTKQEDIRFLQEVGINGYGERLDIVSLAVLALRCMANKEHYYQYLHANFVKLLLDKVELVGLPGSVDELSLIIQALNGARVDTSYWNRSQAMKLLLSSQNDDGSFGDILATYHVIPILSGRSLQSLGDSCNIDFSNGDSRLASLKKSKGFTITVFYSLFLGNPFDMTQKMQLQVEDGTSLLYIMELAEEENPNFRFKLDTTKDKPMVYSIGGIPNDAERGLYWILHVRDLHRNDYVQYDKDIRYYTPSDGEEIAFWLRQIKPL